MESPVEPKPRVTSETSFATPSTFAHCPLHSDADVARDINWSNQPFGQENKHNG
jgi:hypothetical protein